MTPATTTTRKPAPAWARAIAAAAGGTFAVLNLLTGPALAGAAIYAGASMCLQAMGHPPLHLATGPMAGPVALFAGLAAVAGQWATDRQQREERAAAKLWRDRLEALVAGDRRLFESRVNKLIERAASRGR